jgi:hypothetical protein
MSRTAPDGGDKYMSPHGDFARPALRLFPGRGFLLILPSLHGYAGQWAATTRRRYDFSDPPSSDV